ncbi:septal ring lytic transglycosylase RlpA family protein [Chelativorans sp. ZYF759]|uniref:septal ring lytic transglycosylase RlpA family protein n=1 Tax=Chelativorans sp. ZYF759 TaxID=2692213 RepID=UPI00145E1D28|nr:septal ring lytic transglycosylase RlpA family protein [Chelativorans sp. ZYF759]
MKLTGLAAVPAALLAFSLLSLEPSHASQQPVAQSASGQASWYGSKFHGRRTANGERYDMHQMTAAHRSLPFGTKVRVTNQRNGRAVVVRINDRGPFAGRRIIDLSRGAAGAIGMVNSGVAPVKLEVLR